MIAAPLGSFLGAIIGWCGAFFCVVPVAVTVFCMAVIALALIAWGEQLAMTATLLGIWGLIGTAAPVGRWTWLARSLS